MSDIEGDHSSGAEIDEVDDINADINQDLEENADTYDAKMVR